MRTLTRAAAGVFLFAVSISVAGCGAPAGKASGKVTFGGEPVSGAEVGFEMQADPNRQAFGTSAENGTYTLNYPEKNGLPLGKYAVTVTRYTLRNGKSLPGGEKGAALRADEGKVVSKQYQFDVELHEGSNTLDFELKEGKEKMGGS